jgi:hypothetical protein
MFSMLGISFSAARTLTMDDSTYEISAQQRSGETTLYVYTANHGDLGRTVVLSNASTGARLAAPFAAHAEDGSHNVGRALLTLSQAQYDQRAFDTLSVISQDGQTVLWQSSGAPGADFYTLSASHSAACN